MRDLDKTAWEILNATADDSENLEQIYRQVCCDFVELDNGKNSTVYKHRPVASAPHLDEIASHVRDLVEQGLLAVQMDENGSPWPDGADLSFVWRGWFAMTPQGRSVWESSEYFVEQEQPQ